MKKLTALYIGAVQNAYLIKNMYKIIMLIMPKNLHINIIYRNTSVFVNIPYCLLNIELCRYLIIFFSPKNKEMNVSTISTLTCEICQNCYQSNMLTTSLRSAPIKSNLISNLFLQIRKYPAAGSKVKRHQDFKIKIHLLT